MDVRQLLRKKVLTERDVVGRRILNRVGDYGARNTHTSTLLSVDVKRDRATIKPGMHKKPEVERLSGLRIWWSGNPDLHAKYLAWKAENRGRKKNPKK